MDIQLSDTYSGVTIDYRDVRWSQPTPHTDIRDRFRFNIRI